MQIEAWKIDDVRPYHNNPRVNDQAVAAVAASIREFGFRQPIVVDEEGVIIVGHTRWKAARLLEQETVPVHVARGLSPAQVKALRLADNKTGELSGWDAELLPAELLELQAFDFNLDLIGFTPEELNVWLDPGCQAGLTDPDAVPAPPDAAITQAGDLWMLGNHRLLCGDSSRTEDVDCLLQGAPIHLVNMDPPYNVGVAPRSNNAIAAGLSSFSGMKPRRDVEPPPRKLRAKDRPLKNDFVSEQEFERLLDAWFGNAARVLLPGHSFYVWGGYANCANYPPQLRKHGLYFSQAIIWDKQHPVLTRKDFMGAHEWCFYGWKEGAAHRFFGPNNASDLWQVKKVSPQVMIHLTEKPVELAQRAIQYSTCAGEHVLDLFGGSGSTLIACQQTNRRAFLMEIDPPYCDIIVRRWEAFTGRQAERIMLDGNGAELDRPVVTSSTGGDNG